MFHIKENAKSIDYNNQNEKYAYTIDNNLFEPIMTNIQITVKKMNRNIVFGQAVHRYEFGITKVHFGPMMEVN